MSIHQQVNWPAFHWDEGTGDPTRGCAAPARPPRRTYGSSIGFRLREEAVLGTLILDVLKTCEIEGEVLDREQVRSSLARRLGMDIGGLVPADQDVEGVVEMMLDATQHFDKPLDEDRLFGWHAALFPAGRSGMHRIRVEPGATGSSGPMQVVSGPVGKSGSTSRTPPPSASDAR